MSPFGSRKPRTSSEFHQDSIRKPTRITIFPYFSIFSTNFLVFSYVFHRNFRLFPQSPVILRAKFWPRSGPTAAQRRPREARVPSLHGPGLAAALRSEAEMSTEVFWGFTGAQARWMVKLNRGPAVLGKWEVSSSIPGGLPKRAMDGFCWLISVEHPLRNG